MDQAKEAAAVPDLITTEDSPQVPHMPASHRSIQLPSSDDGLGEVVADMEDFANNDCWIDLEEMVFSPMDIIHGGRHERRYQR